MIDDSTDDVNYLGGRSADGLVAPAFFVNQRVLALRDGIFSPATVEAIESTDGSGNTGGSGGRFFYYVHFADADRRMDTWVEADALRVAVGQNNRRSTKAGKQGTTHHRPLVTRRQSMLQQEQQQQQQQQQDQQPTREGSGASSATACATTSSIIAATVASAAQAEQQQQAALQLERKVQGKDQHSAHTARNTDSKFFDRPRNVARFFIGEFEVESWYYSPFLLAHPAVRSALENCNNTNIWNSIPSSMTVSIQNRNPSSSSGGGGGAGGASGAAAGGGGGGGASSSAADSGPSGPMAAARYFSLHLCPYCLEPGLDHLTIANHFHVCARRPPGREVYRDPRHRLIVFECDGAVHVAFARNMALVSKAFLEHKSLDYDMCPFVFYVVCRYDDAFGAGGAGGGAGACTVCAYFSREKRNPEGYNLSCILTLPQHQSHGFGRFMIDMSYEMSRREGRPGSPEKPLSDFGERMYMQVWKDRVLDALAAHATMEYHATSIDSLIRATSMIRADVCAALGALKILEKHALPNIKIVVDPEAIRSHLQRKIRRLRSGGVTFEPALLHHFPQWYAPGTSHQDVPRPKPSIQIPSEAAMGEQQHNPQGVAATMPLVANRRRQRNA